MNDAIRGAVRPVLSKWTGTQIPVFRKPRCLRLQCKLPRGWMHHCPQQRRLSSRCEHLRTGMISVILFPRENPTTCSAFPSRYWISINEAAVSVRCVCVCVRACREFIQLSGWLPTAGHNRTLILPSTHCGGVGARSGVGCVVSAV